MSKINRDKINIKSDSEIKIMRECGKRLNSILRLIEKKIEPGISGDELERIANLEIKKCDSVSSFKGYKENKCGYSFPSALCISINDEVVHGFPYGKIIKDGDVVGIDLGIKYKGFHADSAITVGVGNVSNTAERLIETTKESLYEGIKQAVSSNRIEDIGYAIQKYVEKNNFSVVRALVGHGVGRSIHEFPNIPNFGKKGNGLKLRVGMTFAIEPMINEGNYDVKIDDDKWTVRTKDGKLSAHFEHTVAITKNGCVVLTES